MNYRRKIYIAQKLYTPQYRYGVVEIDGNVRTLIVGYLSKEEARERAALHNRLEDLIYTKMLARSWHNNQHANA